MLSVHPRRVKATLHERMRLGRVEATPHRTCRTRGWVEAARHERGSRGRAGSGDRHNDRQAQNPRCNLPHANLPMKEFGATRPKLLGTTE